MNDTINGLFETFGGFFILLHCWQVVKDKQVKGVSLVATIFFAGWSAWNMYYYPTLDQWASFWGGFVVFTANVVWIILMLKYRDR